MPDNNRRGRWKAPLPPDTAKEQPLQTTAYREGGDIRTPSLVTKDTKAYAGKAAAAGFDGPEAADDFDGPDAQTQENEPDIAAALALFGMDADIEGHYVWISSSEDPTLSDILIDGIEYTNDIEGISIVVFDKTQGRPVDSVTWNTDYGMRGLRYYLEQ